MARFSRKELQDAFDHYREVADEAGRTGDWRPWADLFTDDATYVEHLFGTFTGPDEIHGWIDKTMRTPPNDRMREFPTEWYVLDEDKGWVICCIQNRMDDPGDGRVHQAANWTLLEYAGDNKWSKEEDLYNPQEFAEMIRGWEAARQAGG